MSRGKMKDLSTRDLITLDECIIRAQEFLKMDEPPFGKRRLQNRMSAGEFTRYGTYHKPMIDWAEVARTLNWKRKVS